MRSVSVEESAAERRARFEALAPGLVEPLRRFLARRTDPATADDVLADTLLVCWRRLDDVPDEPLPWAYGVARHCLANAERGARRQERVAAKIAVVDPPRSSGPEPAADAPTLHEALAALRPEDAELLRLWAWEQLTPAEIAVVLDVTPNAVSIRLHRAREKLRERLAKGQRLPDMRSRRRGGTMSETDGPDRRRARRARLRAPTPPPPSAGRPRPGRPTPGGHHEPRHRHPADHETRATGTRDRSPLTWLVAAAAVLSSPASGVFASVARGRPATPADAPPRPRARDVAC